MISKLNYFLDKYLGIEIIGTRPKEAVRFAKHYFNKTKIDAIEIGVLRGQNSGDILDSLNIRTLHLIDPYWKYSEYESDSNWKNIESVEKKAKRRLSFYPNEKVNWIKDYSENAVKKIEGKVDFIYIDGNHEYEFVKKDLELYWEKLRIGGIISGHDIQYSGVSRAVLEFATKKGFDVHFGDRRDWWIIKRSSKGGVE